jgi:hypothetical protein
MSLRIAFDLDGVLADMDSALIRHAETLFGEPMTRRLQERAGDASATPQRDPPAAPDEAAAPGETGDGGQADVAPQVSRLGMTARQQRRLWRHVGSIESFWEHLEEIEPGAVACLAAAATERRWELIFLTKRPSTLGATAQVQSQRWLEAKGFAHPSVYVVQGSRGRIADALGLDIVVDDRPENCLAVVVDSKARAILVWRDDEQQLPATARRLGIGVVKSVDECLNILTEVDAAGQQPNGVMDRMKRFFGLDKSASA